MQEWGVGESSNPFGALATIITDFTPVPRVLLLLGFLIFLVGIQAGFRLDNRPMMIGVALIASAFAGHYWPEVRFGPIYAGDEKSAGIRWGNIFLAVLFSAIAIAAAWIAYSPPQKSLRAFYVAPNRGTCVSDDSCVV